MNTENLYGMWISPKGDIWEIYKSMSSHEDMARQITGGIFPELDDFLPETKYLIMSGYCRVVFENSSNIVSMEFLEKLTRHQKEYLEIFREEKRHVCEQWDVFLGSLPRHRARAERTKRMDVELLQPVSGAVSAPAPAVIWSHRVGGVRRDRAEPDCGQAAGIRLCRSLGACVVCAAGICGG